MPTYDISDQSLMVREYLGTKVYMASHPKIRRPFRSGKRPTEFGDKVWDATLGLMLYLDDKRFESVMDVGCGWGILGIHLARTTGARLTSVDADPNLEEVVLAHAELNGVDVKFMNIGFGDLKQGDLTCELIVGAEICYSDEVEKDLRTMIDRAAKAKTREILIADLGRPDFDTLCNHCSDHYGATLQDLWVPGVEKPRRLLSMQF